MKSYDLRRTEAVTATLDADGLATEVTLAGIKAQTDLLTFTGDDLNVAASVNADGLATEITLADVLLQNKRMENLLVSLLEEQQMTNKYLKKIYNPE